MTKVYRIGQIVPSSNTTMETEVPAMFRAREAVLPERFSFHSSRVRMQHVTAAELAKMVADSDRCAAELSDARVDVIAYACLVAIMSMGRGFHRTVEKALGDVAAANSCAAPIVSSAGALIDGLHHLGARRISIVTPYLKPLTKTVVDYIENEGIEVVDAIALEIPNNLHVGARDPMALVEESAKLNIAGVDAVVLSACVQMPSLQAIPIVESRLGIPVLSAAGATAFCILRALGLETYVPGAGRLLSNEALAPALAGA